MSEVITGFYERGRLLGEMHTEDYTHVSVVYVCPMCGIAWGGRVTIVDNELMAYIGETRRCTEHGNSQLISPFDPIEALPNNVMARDICFGIQEWL